MQLVMHSEKRKAMYTLLWEFERLLARVFILFDAQTEVLQWSLVPIFRTTQFLTAAQERYYYVGNKFQCSSQCIELCC